MLSTDEEFDRIAEEVAAVMTEYFRNLLYWHDDSASVLGTYYRSEEFRNNLRSDIDSSEYSPDEYVTQLQMSILFKGPDGQ